MSGTPLSIARFAGLLSTVAKTLAALPMSDDVAKSWEENGAELASRLGFLTEAAPLRKPKSKLKPKFQIQPDGTITFSVKSNGTTGKEWIAKLEASGHKVSDYAKQLLLSTDFVPTKGVVTKIVVLPGKFWSSDNVRTSKHIRAEADNRKLSKPNAEVACLMRMIFSNEDIVSMGLSWLIAMHAPIKDSDGYPGLLGTDALGGDPWLNAFWDYLGGQWGERGGFAFAVSHVSTL